MAKSKPANPTDKKTKRGYTLLEVVLAVVVVAIAVASTLVIMSKMMGYTAKRGQAIDIANAISISQMAIDHTRDQKFPPTESYGNLTGTPYPGGTPMGEPVTGGRMTVTMSNIPYEYTVDITAADTSVVAGESVINGTSEYGAASGGIDSMSGYRNLLKIRVNVYKAGRPSPILTTTTYKTRNGYY